MKTIKMYFTILITILMAVGCKNTITKSDNKYDDILIQNIIDAEKIDINISELPSESIEIIDLDYNDYIEINASIAFQFGYQISLDGKGYKPGEHNEIYFDLEGKRLKSKRDKSGKGSFKCFELVLPILFKMPDGLYITVEGENDYSLVRDWYIENSQFEEKPILQYPLNIIYKDGNVDIINNDAEMTRYKETCKKWDDNKNEWQCFEIIYPITFSMIDGSEILMNNKHDWIDLKLWYEENPGSQDRPLLKYPVEIIYSDEKTKIISNDEEMDFVKQDCI